MFVNTPEGVQRIVHKFSIDDDIRMPERLTMLEYWPTELGASWISLAEVEREVKDSAKAHLYFIRDSQGDPDEDLACRRGDSDENLGHVVH